MGTPQTARSRAAALLLPRFIAHRQRDLDEARVALGRDDYDAIARLGHNMRGNGQSFGFPEVSWLGERIETSATAHDAAALDQWLVKLEACIAELSTGAPT